MPAQDRQLAGEGDRGDLVAAFCSDSDEEGMQRTWRLGGSPCRFNQHGPRMASTDLADASMMRWPQAGLTNPWIKPEIAHQLLRAGKATDVADRVHDPRCYRRAEEHTSELKSLMSISYAGFYLNNT